MLPSLLLPYRFKWIGLLVFTTGLIILYGLQPDLSDFKDGMGLLVQILVLIGLLLMASSRQKTEDEFIQHCRLVALQWSLLIFILLRLLYKCLAYFLEDPTWQPEGFQVNFLLLLYLALFHYVAVVRHRISALMFKKGTEHEE
ncbi:MAG: hypothetical protein QM534_12425 [Sediminibacterium sp.]|nr:hypothetical protein [Sediminibacterium sp.]